RRASPGRSSTSSAERSTCCSRGCPESSSRTTAAGTPRRCSRRCSRVFPTASPPNRCPRSWRRSAAPTCRRRDVSVQPQGLETDVAGLAAHVGTHLGYSEWRTMTQDEVDRFADLTNDHNWIHVDRERAKIGPFGGTIAHGYLTLALLAPLMLELLRVDGA